MTTNTDLFDALYEQAHAAVDAANLLHSMGEFDLAEDIILGSLCCGIAAEIAIENDESMNMLLDAFREKITGDPKQFMDKTINEAIIATQEGDRVRSAAQSLLATVTLLAFPSLDEDQADPDDLKELALTFGEALVR